MGTSWFQIPFSLSCGVENPGLATQGGSKKEKNSNTTDRKLFAWEMYLGLLLRTREGGYFSGGRDSNKKR